MNYADALLTQIKLLKHDYLRRDLSTKEGLSIELTFLYFLCVATERLFEEAAHESLMRYSGAFIDRLYNYYVSHLEEERGELGILLNDLQSLGIDIGLAMPEPIAVAVIGSQYYLIKHAHPVSFLGYLAFNEADYVPIELVETLEQRYGKDSFQFLRMHALRDVDHAKDLMGVINLVPEDLRHYIGYSARQTFIISQKR